MNVFFEFMQSGGGQVASPTLNPPSAIGDTSVVINCSNTMAHLFYTLRLIGSASDPTHTGDVANTGTVRIGSNSGTVHTATSSAEKELRVLAYVPGWNDSEISVGDYGPAGP